MLTIKFENHFSDGKISSTTVSCYSFDMYESQPNDIGNGNEPVITITTYEIEQDREGVERHIGNRGGDFNVCWVTNSAGKTIDHYTVPIGAQGSG